MLALLHLPTDPLFVSCCRYAFLQKKAIMCTDFCYISPLLGLISKLTHEASSSFYFDMTNPSPWARREPNSVFCFFTGLQKKERRREAFWAVQLGP